MEQLTGADLMTLTMTREIFPYFKQMLEGTVFIVAGDEVRVEVRGEETGVITLWTTVKSSCPTT